MIKRAEKPIPGRSGELPQRDLKTDEWSHSVPMYHVTLHWFLIAHFTSKTRMRMRTDVGAVIRFEKRKCEALIDSIKNRMKLLLMKGIPILHTLRPQPAPGGVKD